MYEEAERRYSPRVGMTVVPDADLIGTAEQSAPADYQDNVMKELFRNMRKSTQVYISRTFTVRDSATGIVKIDDVSEAYPAATSSHLDSRRAYAVNTQILRKLMSGYLVFVPPHFDYGFEPIMDEKESVFGTLTDDDWIVEGIQSIGQATVATTSVHASFPPRDYALKRSIHNAS